MTLHCTLSAIRSWLRHAFPTRNDAWKNILLMRQELLDSARLIERNIYLSDTPQQLHNMQRMIDNLPKLYGRNDMVASWQESLQHDLDHRMKCLAGG